MSLNGLDAQPVTDAYYAAIVEVGGWFLLKYTSRDSVELLSRGKGGVHEARNELLKYEEKSPLYGLIIYRRRKVLIKYIPDGTSRLLQARTAVHFQDVAERYAPYETVLEISHPDELSDTSLASSFPLHTASPAVSTTRLDEISEDAEDGGAGASFPSLPTRTKSNTSAKFGTTRYKAERRVDQLMRAQQGRPSSPFRSAESVPTLSSSPSAGTKPSISQFLVREDSGTRSITSLTPSVASVSEYAGSRSSLVSDASTAKETETAPSTADLDKPEDIPAAQEDEPTPTEPSASVHAPSIREPSPERPSEASNRPTSTLVEEDDRSTITSELSQQKSVPERTKPDYDEPFDFSYLEPKKKIKLGPRPVAATSEKPRKSGNAGTSLLPAAYRPAKKDQQRPTSSIPTGNTNAHMMPLPGTLPAPPPIPDIPEYSPRPVSRGSVKSMPSQKSSTMTPEKLRLMKAVELRKKQMRKSNPQIRTPAPVETMPEVPKVPGHAPEPSQIGQAATTESGLPEKLDSGIDLEGNRQAEIERQTSVPFQKSQTKESTEEEQPAGLLSSPTAQKDASKNATQLPVVEAQAHTLERILNEPQQAGAERSLEPSQISSQPENAALPSLVSSQNTHAPLSEPVAPLPKSDFKSSGDTVVDQTVDETAFSTFPEDLITDVPAIVTTGSSRPQTAEDSTSAPRERSASPLDTRQASGTGSSVSLATPAEEAAKEMSDLAKRRRGLVEPLHIDVDTNRNSVADSLSDNDFLEELQSATFHDARQLSVSKSPGPSAPYFPRNSSYESAGSQSRSPVRQISISNGLSQTAEEDSPDQQPGQQAVHNNGVSPEVEPLTHSGQLSPDSISPIDGQSPNPSLRRNVSSGIKGRIQALNELSNRESSAVPVHIPTRAMSPDQGALFFGNERKAGVRSPHSRTGSAFRLRPNVERAGSASNGVQQSEGPAPVWSTTHDTTSNRNSVSVKARIVRPNADGSSDRPSDPADLHESQIEINHLRGIPTPTSVSQAFLPPMPTPPAEPASPDHRSLHSLRRKSLGRSKASTPAPNDENRPASPSRTSTEEHGGSRTSRFFKRMSTFGSASKRRSIAGPSAAALVNPTESPSSRTGSVSNNAAPAATPTAPVDRDTPPAVQVGDLNVQFPDTLLWKRRWLSLDDSGHLHLSPPTSQQPHHLQPRPGKKFHLSDFKAPYAPDLDRQELPHSICLEFTGVQAPESDSAFVGGEGIGGGVLQVACEDAMGQRQVLKLLGGYWRSWADVAK